MFHFYSHYSFHSRISVLRTAYLAIQPKIRDWLKLKESAPFYLSHTLKIQNIIASFGNTSSTILAVSEDIFGNIPTSCVVITQQF